MPTNGLRMNIGLITTLILGLATTATAQADDNEAYAQLLKDRGPTIVTIKLMIKISGGPAGADGQETEQETTGVMIDPHGLVLASSTELGGVPPAIRQMMAQMGGSMTITPKDIKIFVGDDTEGVEATLLARDSELDLAWLQIKEPGDKTFAAIDLLEFTRPTIGQRLIAVTRMGKFFDRVQVIDETRVAGRTSKPRELYVPSVPIGQNFCTPVYTTRGELVGVTVLQIPDIEGSPNNPLAAASQLGSMDTVMGGFILPADAAAKATERARAAISQPAETPESPGE